MSKLEKLIKLAASMPSAGDKISINVIYDSGVWRFRLEENQGWTEFSGSDLASVTGELEMAILSRATDEIHRFSEEISILCSDFEHLQKEIRRKKEIRDSILSAQENHIYSEQLEREEN